MDEYTRSFHRIFQEIRHESGYEIPEEVETYVVMLLSNYVDKPDFLPETSFAAEFSKLDKFSSLSAKQLGDTCLFLSGLFPLYGRKYGLNKTYYKDIGKSSYDLASKLLNEQLFSVLAWQFDFIASYIHLATKPNILPRIIIRNY